MMSLVSAKVKNMSLLPTVQGSLRAFSQLRGTVLLFPPLNYQGGCTDARGVFGRQRRIAAERFGMQCAGITAKAATFHSAFRSEKVAVVACAVSFSGSR